MNEHDAASQPPLIPTSPSPEAPLEPPKPPPVLPKPFSWWLRKFLACNPFYLASAALLLFGCYRVSIDAPIFNLETARLLFNFSSVQIYEVLLVCTAIFLARRSLWYDSTLLVGLENLLVFVPFILISQAALIDPGMALVMCLAGAAVAMIRFGGLKKYFAQLNLPGRVLEIGTVLLALNVALPLLYRHFGETKIGIHIESGAAYEMNEFTWLLILPAVLGLANFLPRAGAGGNLPPQHRWLPAGMFALWVAVTGVHLYGLDYVYQFEFRSELFAPSVWVLAWTASRIFSANTILPKYALAIPPALAPLFACSSAGNKTFFILAGLNIAGYCAASLFDRKNRVARHLLFGSILLLVAGLPDACRQLVAPGLLRAHWVAAGLTAYLLFCTALSHNPKLAIFGAMVSGVTVLALFGNHAGAIHWAAQSCLVFLLLHSLRWQDAEHHGAKLVRVLTCLVWMAHAFVWMNSADGQSWMSCIPGALVLGIFYARQLFCHQRGELIVPAAATMVVLSGPVCAIVTSIRAMPTGLLAVIGSFALFGLGTAAAMTRHLWHKNQNSAGREQAPSAEAPR